MDTAALASFLVASKRQDTRMAVTMAVIRQQQTMDQNLLGMLADGLQTGGAGQDAPPPGMGVSVDVTV